MNWISQSFDISNFVSSRLKFFSGIDFLKKLLKLHKKTPVCSSVFSITLQASNLPAENLIKKETPAQVFSAEDFKNTLFIEHLQVTTSALLHGTHLVAMKVLIHLEVPTRVSQQGELN